MGMLSHFGNNIKRHQTRFMLFMLVALLIMRAVAAHLDWGWHFAASLSFGLTAIFLAYAYIMHDDLLKKIVWFGIIAGFTELAADWWLVDITQTLIYAENEPMIVRSPIYMPFAWAMVLTNIGYLSYSLLFKEPRWLAVLSTMIIGATVIPLFEYFAYGAGWWKYVDCPMVLDVVPYYIILGEALICAFLGFIIKYLNHHKKRTVVFLGILQGLWIWVSYFIAYTLLKT